MATDAGTLETRAQKPSLALVQSARIRRAQLALVANEFRQLAAASAETRRGTSPAGRLRHEPR